MSFFNQKEEVLDIQLTRFGKYKLASGDFNPRYYQFFDDDIIYNSEFAGFKEKQNDTQKRILEETPRIKSGPNVSRAESEFLESQFSLSYEEDNLTTPTYSFQEKVLLYPLANSESGTKESPHFSLLSYDSLLDVENFSSEFPFLSLDFSNITDSSLGQATVSIGFSPKTNFLASEDSVVIFKDSSSNKIAFTFSDPVTVEDTAVSVVYNEGLSSVASMNKSDIVSAFQRHRVKFQYLSDHGVYKKIPQLSVKSDYTIIKYPGIENADTTRDNNSNNFIDLTSETVEFLDKSALHVTGSRVVVSLEEANTHYNLSNFELEIYEIDETTENTTPGKERGPTLRKIKNIDQINSLFHIKTDEDVTQVRTPFGEKRNWYRSGE